MMKIKKKVARTVVLERYNEMIFIVNYQQLNETKFN